LADLPTSLTAALADRYLIERELGRGGMATVYLARDLRHRRRVALKLLHPKLAYALGADRFLREIEVAANLTHPHILPLHDSGEVEGLLYYVMPYVEGESLRDRLSRVVQLPLEDAIQVARNVGAALAYAHGQGIIHRDIKPENILLEGDEAVVADFGIAKAVSAAGGDRLTETGMAVGTAVYMSPEQASGERQLDGRSDVYSLGCVLYEMLAGEPPHTGPTAQAVIAKRLSDPVPLVGRLRPTVSEGLEQVVTKALAPVPADRFATAAEFVRALQPSLATPKSTLSTRGGRPRYHVRAAALTLVTGIFIGLGVLFAWRRSSPGIGADGGTNVLAVLPFESLGDSSQAYFADGVSDEVRGKLSQLAGLAVIARASSKEYRNTSKSAQQIARELGADYLLTGTVRWEKHPDGTSRVRVSPELVQVEPGAAPRTKWQEGFDAPLTDVFQVQADIAAHVAQALHVALGDSSRRELAARPTLSLAAYDAFLRGEGASQGMSTIDPPSLRQAIAAYEQAVALDSSFALAWAQLARAHAALYLIGTVTPAGAETARRAAERALSLAPMRPEGHQSLAAYYRSVPRDLVRAYAEDSTALALAPGSADLLGAVGWDERNLGRWDAARAHLEQAARLDPRSGTTAHHLGELLLNMRRYPEAERALEHALQLLPANLGVRADRATLELARGDLAQARRIINAVPKEVDPTTLVAFLSTYQDLIWVLDEAQQELLLRLTPSAFDDDRGSWGIVLAQAHALQGNMAKARAYADSVRLAWEPYLRQTPQDHQRRALLGLALAYLRQKAAAVREGERAMALLPSSRDAYFGPYIQHQLVRIYLVVGEPELALDRLEPLLEFPYPLSPDWLKIDPTFDPLRNHPRFQRLIEGRN
jgi:serine/threonine-protein kinase